MNAKPTPFAESMRVAAGASLPGSGLGWLDDARASALAAFLDRGLPDARNELWKYTSLRALAARGLAAVADDADTLAIDLSALPAPARDASRLVFVNGRCRTDLSRLDGLPRGVEVRALSQALRDQPEPLRFLLGGRGNGDDDGFTLLNRALAGDGIILRVDEGVEVAGPLHIVHLATPQGAASACHLRDLVELGRGARLALVEHWLGDSGAGLLVNAVREVQLREGARLDWTLAQDAGAATSLIRRSDVLVQDDAALALRAFESGAKLARHELRVELAGTRARFEGRGAFVLGARQHADSELLISHRGRDTASSALWRGVAGGRARGVVHGRILVAPGADGADGSFYNHNLLLSDDAEIDTRPALEIYADEVQANHGATVGELDREALFYLRSRGVPLERARQMLVRGFCAVVLDGVADDELRAQLDALLDAALPGEAA